MRTLPHWRCAPHHPFCHIHSCQIASADLLLTRTSPGYSINSILYQRGIYPPECFRKVSKYGLAMMMTSDEGLDAYLQNVLKQLAGARSSG